MVNAVLLLFSKQPRVLRLLRGHSDRSGFETCVPCQCFGCRTCDTWYTRYAFGCRRTGEVFFENTTVVIFFFVLWRIDRETFCCMLHFLVADSGCCNCFQGVNPRISHSVGELLFLSPCYTLWQKRSKASRTIRFSMVCPGHIFTAGFRRMATSRNSLSRNGTRPSTPHAESDLLARSSRTSGVWRACGQFLRGRLPL